MLIGIIGKLGSGKTLLLARLMHLFEDTHFNCSNFYCQYSDYITSAEEMILRIDEIESDRPRKFYIDEIGVVLSALNFYKDESEVMVDIATKSRKLKTDIYYTSQHMMMVDRQIRRITDIILHVTSKNLKNGDIEIMIQPFEHNGLYTVESIPKKFIGNYYFDTYNTDEIIIANKEAVMKFFVEKVKKNIEVTQRIDIVLDSEISEKEKIRKILEILKFYLNISGNLGKMILFDLYRI